MLDIAGVFRSLSMNQPRCGVLNYGKRLARYTYGVALDSRIN